MEFRTRKYDFNQLLKKKKLLISIAIRDLSALFKLYINSVPGVIELFLCSPSQAGDLYIIYYLQLKPLLSEPENYVRFH